MGPLFPVSPGYGLKTLDLSDQEDAFSALGQANIVNLIFCGKPNLDMREKVVISY